MIRRRDIIEGLKNRGYEAEAHTSVKNGVELKGIRFMNKSGICPVIYTDSIIEESESLSAAIENVLDAYHNADIMEFDIENMKDPDFILKHVYIGLQKQSYEEIVKAGTNFEGIEKYLYVKMSENASFKLTYGLLETLQLDNCDVWNIAEKNTFKNTQIVSIVEILSKITGQGIEEWSGIPMQFVVGNNMDFRGASAILDVKSLEKFAEKINKHRFFVLPSSVHEMIIIPDDGTCSIEELNAMVREVNQTQVEPEERLTDRAYTIEV